MNLHEVKDNPPEPTEEDYRVVEVWLELIASNF